MLQNGRNAVLLLIRQFSLKPNQAKLEQFIGFHFYVDFINEICSISNDVKQNP